MLIIFKEILSMYWTLSISNGNGEDPDPFLRIAKLTEASTNYSCTVEATPEQQVEIDSTSLRLLWGPIVPVGANCTLCSNRIGGGQAQYLVSYVQTA